MVTVDPRTALERMSTSECWELLASVPVGRIGVLNDSAPEIYPVNHVVDDKTIVIRTGPGVKLRALLRSPCVCYEIDGVDPDGATGWSVLVKGRAVEVRNLVGGRVAEVLGLEHWAPGDKDHWVRIMPAEVSGRRILEPARGGS